MTRTATAPDGVRIAYEVSGEGEPVVLVHGFASNRNINWRDTQWYRALVHAGRRVIALDCRGHGESGKPHEPAAYDEAIMARDIVAVMDAEDVGAADVMGYSMGGFLTIRLMADHGRRVRRAVLAGVGENYFSRGEAWSETIAAALLAADPAAIRDPVARDFRAFAERGRNDLAALAACMRRTRRIYAPEELAALPQPVLVVCGERDTLTGSPERLAGAFVRGQARTIAGRDHMSTVGDRGYKEAAIRFLAGRG